MQVKSISVSTMFRLIAGTFSEFCAGWLTWLCSGAIYVFASWAASRLVRAAEGAGLFYPLSATAELALEMFLWALYLAATARYLGDVRLGLTGANVNDWIRYLWQPGRKFLMLLALAVATAVLYPVGALLAVWVSDRPDAVRDGMALAVLTPYLVAVLLLFGAMQTAVVMTARSTSPKPRWRSLPGWVAKGVVVVLKNWPAILVATVVLTPLLLFMHLAFNGLGVVLLTPIIAVLIVLFCDETVPAEPICRIP